MLTQLNNFVVVGVYRTGSTPLARLVGLHLQTACGWEWTQRVAPWRTIFVAEAGLRNDFSILSPKHRDHMLRQVSQATSWIGFRRLFRASANCLLHPSLAPSLQQYPHDAQVTIPLREAAARLRLKGWIDGQLSSLRDANPYILIEYEDLKDASGDVYARIEHFLGLDPCPFRPEVLGQRQSAGMTLEKQIQNFSELVRFLSDRGLLMG